MIDFFIPAYKYEGLLLTALLEVIIAKNYIIFAYRSSINNILSVNNTVKIQYGRVSLQKVILRANKDQIIGIKYIEVTYNYIDNKFNPDVVKQWGVSYHDNLQV